MSTRRLAWTGAAVLIASAATASAQSTIAGTVKDAAGAAVAGVTVEASSDVLIERSRAAVSDDQGRYAIVDVRPGVYRVVFRKAGFTTLAREAIDVPANTAATVDAELVIGAVAETVTVTVERPLLDLRHAGRVQVMARDVMDAIPTARTFQSIGALVPGLRLTFPEVGGSGQMEPPRMQARGNAARHATVQIDGILVNTAMTDGEVQNFIDNALVQETTYQISGVAADTSAGGVRVNMIPRDGGNIVAAQGFLGGSPGRWQSHNLTPSLTARGLRGVTSVNHIQDFNGAVGGPVVRNRLWYFASARYQSTNDTVPNSFYRDGSPGVQDQWIAGGVARATWQVTSRHKVSAMLQRSWKFKGHDLQSLAQTQTPADPAVASTRREPGAYYIAHVKWMAPLTDRWLTEAGYASDVLHFTNLYQPGIRKDRGTPEWYASASRVDLTTQLRHAAGVANQTHLPDRHVFAGSATYVTGSHAVKTGAQLSIGSYTQIYDMNADLYQNYLNGQPATVTVWSTPVRSTGTLDADLGLYVQDTWAVGRASLSAGVRYEYLRSSVPAQQRAAGRFAPAASYAAVNCRTNPGMTCWHSVMPRVGVAYDVFGNGRTALKAGFGAYTTPETTGFVTQFNPVSVVLENRAWTDRNGDNIAQDEEIGASANPNFGRTPGRTLDPQYRREYNRQHHAGLQQQFGRGVEAGFAWYRRTLHNAPFSDNRSVNARFTGADAHWSPATVTNPLTGEAMTVFNLNPASFGVPADLYLTNASADERRNVYTGFEATASGRLPNGARLSGGWNVERTINVACDTADDPNLLRFCDQGGTSRLGEPARRMPFRHELKVTGHVPLWYAIEVSATLQSYPGLPKEVNWTLTRASRYPADCRVPGCTPGALVIPSLVNPSVTVPLIAPGSRFRDRLHQLDIAVRRLVRRGRARIALELDVFNALNSSAVLTEVFTLGNSVAPFAEDGPGGTPLSLVQPRIYRVALQFQF